MHIRHDYNTWVEWEQNTVRSVCGRTVAKHNAGIPGVSGVDIKDWCWRCSKATTREIGRVLRQTNVITVPSIWFRYQVALKVTTARDSLGPPLRTRRSAIYPGQSVIQ